jgi:hypothetical protein
MAPPKHTRLSATSLFQAVIMQAEKINQKDAVSKVRLASSNGASIEVTY